MRGTRDGAGRTFVQDGFDARTGDEREPGSNPENRERRHPRSSDKEGWPGCQSKREDKGAVQQGEREKEEGETAQA